ncbi:ATP-binding protein [Streptomyces sp. NPDC087440]|uniref:ATP-binding protein n=1 Tax=Streptomyces sp. NPDC087440 TaxID=3365790 RepID=UPI00383087CD
MTTSHLTLTLPYDPSHLTHLRRILSSLLSCWELDRFADDAALITSELVGNVQHTDSPSYRLYVERQPHTLLIEVGDDCPAAPALPAGGLAVDPLALSGRGLPLVAALAARIGITPRVGGGKSVWAHLATGGRQPSAARAELNTYLLADGEDECCRCRRKLAGTPLLVGRFIGGAGELLAYECERCAAASA